MKFSNVVKHFCVITKHKWYVLKLCIKAGIPWRGLVHDLSKYSPTEFWESAKYYQGDRSPIVASKKENGYSKAWLHHKGRNKHHPEYWYDQFTPDKRPIMPYAYTVEMLCDNLAAGIVYNGKNWTRETQLNYWQHTKSSREIINSNIQELITEVYVEVSKQGIDKTMTKANMQYLYKKYCENKEKGEIECI